MPYVIAVCHQKGGVAKTTTTLALGACFAEQQRETLIIDLDPQASLTTGLGLNPSEIAHSASDVLLGLETLSKLVIGTELPHMSVIPSNADMIMAGQLLQSLTRYEYKLRDSLADPEMAHYDLIVLDCPPTLGALTVAAMTAANMVIIPTQCEYFSMQALNSTFELVRAVRVKTNSHLKYRLLITMFDLRGRLHSQALGQLQQHFNNSMFRTIIGFDSKLRESQVAGKPITTYAQISRSAQQYRQLAEELLTYVQRPVLQTA
ncbi:MAG TPA: ParA family protein [Anaerolineales bacterium]|nr:ParA family protein [Anaerolineales bacterium]